MPKMRTFSFELTQEQVRVIQNGMDLITMNPTGPEERATAEGLKTYLEATLLEHVLKIPAGEDTVFQMKL